MVQFAIEFAGVDVLVETLQENFGSTWCRHAGGNTCEHVSITAFDVVMQAVFAKAYIKACVTLTGIGYMVEFVSVTPGVDMLVGLHGLR